MTRLGRTARLVMVLAGLLFYPALYVPGAFFRMEDLYRETVHHSFRPPFAEYLRDAAANLEDMDEFSCHESVGDHGPIFDAIIAHRMYAINPDPLDTFMRVWKWNPPLLRRGYPMYDVYAEWSDFAPSFELHVLRPQCHLQNYAEEPLPPIAIVNELREQLRLHADKMDEAVASYEPVRPWLYGIIYSWIAFEVLGLLIAMGFAWQFFKDRARKRASATPDEE